LVLVDPRDPKVLTRQETKALASGASQVLAQARIVSTLTQALDGITFACATAMTPRDFGPPTYAPRALFDSLAHTPHRVAFIFGTERYGLSNEDVYRCHACLSIPTSSAYGSLNLAQAVQLLAYDWRQALGGFAVSSALTAPPCADAQALTGLLDHWERALIHLNFLDPAAPRKLMARLNQILNRTQLSEQEVHILRGIARAIEKK
jgi:tRNA/rRNA methyltransferase